MVARDCNVVGPRYYSTRIHRLGATLFRLSASISVCLLLAPAVAFAGEEIVYEEAPGWIEKAELPDVAGARSGNLVIYDEQFRLEQGRLWQYQDVAIRLGTPQELTQAGTLSATWLPDKGDLLVHEVSILRGDEVIDVIAGGTRLEILRRERSLEQRMLDGMLTATLPVPGLRVGDVLRMRYSTTLSDQVLGDEVQHMTLLPRKPDFRAGFSRIRASWDKDLPVRWKILQAEDVPEPDLRDGFYWLDVDVPLDKADEMPRDAPPRYHFPAVLQVATFADWSDVSRVMAPYYHAQGMLDDTDELQERLALIRREQPDQLAQAIAALKLVQDEIGYLANGLDGGNYIPQTPAETWQLRYGDCKAKTLLLLSILSDLGIEAEAVLVNLGGGDIVGEMLPIAAAFNHVIVRARVEGADYWLDGTSTGANLEVAGNVPPHRFGLPIRSEGAGLERIEQVLPRAADNFISVEFDQTAGVDIPTLYTAHVRLLGPIASPVNAMNANLTEDQVYDLLNGMMYPVVGTSQITGFEFIEGDDTSVVEVEVRGLLSSPMQFTGNRGEQRFNLPGNRVGFSPDRARRKWRDIPVQLAGPMVSEVTFRYHLPEDGEGFALNGPVQVDEETAGTRIQRTASLDGDILTIHERVDFNGGEVAPADIAEMRREAAGVDSLELVLVAPDDIPRRWDFADNADRSSLEAVEAAYARLIERDPDDVGNWMNRARFRALTYDMEGALADADRALGVQETADQFAYRSGLRFNMEQFDAALEDAEEAYGLDPSPGRAIWLSRVLVEVGEIDEAIDLLESQEGDENTRRSLELTLAGLDGVAGRPEEGLARIDELLVERPDDPQLLNARCWHMGTWNYRSEEAVASCTRAVEVAPNPGQVLDSRSLAFLRTGDYSRALMDANAALASNPDQHQTLFLRGLIRLRSGDRGGQVDVSQALARAPVIAVEYARYGLSAED